MKKYETLKAVVILQAVSMIALAGFVIWYLWPQSNDNEAQLPTQDLSKANAEDEVVAVIAEHNITKQQLVDELLLLYGNQTLQNILEHYAIQLAAQDNNIIVTEAEVEEQLAIRAQHYDSVEQYVQVMTEQVGILPDRLYQDIEDELLLQKIAIKDIFITDGEIEAYLADYPDFYANRYALGLEWIVVEDQELAKKLLNRIQAGEAFNMLAAQYSIDEYTAESGGKLGLIDEDDIFYPEAIRAAARRLEVGSVTGPIIVDNGYALIKLVEKRVVHAVTEQQRVELARKQLALEKADSLDQLLQRLTNAYGSLITKQKL